MPRELTVELRKAIHAVLNANGMDCNEHTDGEMCPITEGRFLKALDALDNVAKNGVMKGKLLPEFAIAWAMGGHKVYAYTRGNGAVEFYTCLNIARNTLASAGENFLKDKAKLADAKSFLKVDEFLAQFPINNPIPQGAAIKAATLAAGEVAASPVL